MANANSAPLRTHTPSGDAFQSKGDSDSPGSALYRLANEEYATGVSSLDFELKSETSTQKSNVQLHEASSRKETISGSSGHRTRERWRKKVRAVEEDLSKRLDAIRQATLRQEVVQRRAERRMKESQAQRRREAQEAEALLRQEEAAAQEASLESVHAIHRQRFKELQTQRQKDEEIHQRWEALQRDRELKAREEQTRAKQERERLDQERRTREDRERREREERSAREQRERREREEYERLRQERRARDERERAEAAEQRRRTAEERERQVRAEEERRARDQQARGDCVAEQKILELYELKWAELKTNQDLCNFVGFHEFPFPILSYYHTDPAEVTHDHVRDFIFHPLRQSTASKTRKEILKAELLRWHPDKFEPLIRSKMREEDWPRTKEAADMVVRLVTSLMRDS